MFDSRSNKINKKKYMKNLPEQVKKELLEFIMNIPVKKFSSQWNAIQVAISMITSPGSFRKGLHVYLISNDESREPGYYNIKRMSIKIWPHKIQLRREHKEYLSGSDIDINKIYRYIYPNEKYHVSDFEELMSDTSDFFCACYYNDESDYDGHYITHANFNIETNIE